ncbi:glycosyltransferase family 2 protein [Lysinibacillus fusiformis]|uniref:glycosyltransferase family 2 protein n=1 Tax=Lysinibacillus fusiformis TaxID=28031 RepID=UPI003D012B68
MGPEITVLMPVYNASEFLKCAIESILNQTFTNFEFLIIDDGSTDNSLEIIKSIQDERIKVITHTKNLGLVATLNKGIEQAKGQFIARMDADDIALPTRLEKQYAFMSSNCDYGVCGTWLKVIGSEEIYNYPTDHEQITASLLFYCALGHPTVMLRKAILDKKCIRYNNVYAEDYDLWVRLSRITKLYNVPEVLLEYRIHDSEYRFSNQHRTKQMMATVKIREDQLRYLGVKTTECDLEIHHSIGDNNFIYNEKFIEKLKMWITKIQQVSNYKTPYRKMIEKIESSINKEIQDITKILLEIQNKVNNHKLYVWGTGSQAEKDIILLNEFKIPIKNFIDSNYSKRGKYFYNKKILSPVDINDEDNAIFIISSMYYKIIEKEILKMGFQEKNIYKLKNNNTLIFY